MTRSVGLAAAAYLFLYVVASLAMGQQVIWLGDVARVVPPLALAAVAIGLARRCRGQARVFWNLNAAHGLIWAAGQVVGTYFAVVRGGVPVISPADPIFFVSSIPLAAALYGRPDRARRRWLVDIMLLDFVLIALFAAFVYIYFVASIAAALAQLLNASNLLIALWAAFVWATSKTPAWRRVLGIYAVGLAAAFIGGILYEVAGNSGGHILHRLWGLGWMVPFVVLAIAAAMAYDGQMFEPDEAAPPLARPPVLSLVAIALLVAIPAIDEAARRMSSVSPATEALRTRLALLMVIPFGLVVVGRELLSRRALVDAGRELVGTHEQLLKREKLAAVGQLVSGVAHELNNPLQGVLGYTELMLAGKNTPVETEELRAILDNANRAAGIVRNLLTFAGRGSSARGWHQISRIVRDAVAVREPHLQAQGIDFSVELADRLPLVYVDQTRLTEVLMTLIRNAETAIASRRDGRTPRSLVPARRRGEVTIIAKWQAAPDRILVEVADNGRGLTDEDLSRIFDPFFTTRATGQDASLGLSVCHGIVREHGGTITARNQERGGAVFTIELPVMAESLAAEFTTTRGAYPPPPSEARQAPPAAAFAMIPPPDDDVDLPPRRRTALVVDDEESNAALVRRMLDAAGYDVESTTLSRRALVMIERTAYDAVICDVKMPELGGQELYGRVCQIRPEMSRRFIFITGDIDGEDTRVFLDQSHCSYFMKPFNLERLTAAVDLIAGSKPPDTIG